MKPRLVSTLLAVSFALLGCAAPQQPPVSLKPEAVGTRAGRVGVAMTPLPQLDTRTPGAHCLLCLAAASMMNSSLTSHARSLPTDDLTRLKSEMADVLRKQGGQVTEIEGAVDVNALPDRSASEQNFARKDFSMLAQKYNLDKLLIVDVGSLGFERNYSGYIPTSDPRATINLVGYLVDLKTHAYDWYQPVSVTRSAGQVWDEPPQFPGLTNAYFEAIEMSKDSLLQPFSASVTVPVPAAAAPVLPIAARADASQATP